MRRRIKDSGRDQAPDYYVYEFTNIVDNGNAIEGIRWFKETKLLKEAGLIRGEKYLIALSDRPDYRYVKLPFPQEITSRQTKVYIKSGNTIIRVNQKGIEENLSDSGIKQIIKKGKKPTRRNTKNC